jgi:hypothetical protein
MRHDLLCNVKIIKSIAISRYARDVRKIRVNSAAQISNFSAC